MEGNPEADQGKGKAIERLSDGKGDQRELTARERDAKGIWGKKGEADEGVKTRRL